MHNSPISKGIWGNRLRYVKHLQLNIVLLEPSIERLTGNIEQ